MVTFKKGDIVQLKSGGPKMTIDAEVIADKDVFCQWFSGSKVQSGYFGKTALTKVKEPDNEETTHS